MSTFEELDLLPTLQKTLREKKLLKPTEIQERIIPLMLDGESVVGISETGSGKTLAYALPLLHHLKSLEAKYDSVLEEGTPRAVVVVPSRDLGEQIAKVLKTFTHETRLRVRAALGGMPLEQAKRNVAGAFEILLATPGRLVQLIKADQIHLDDVRILVFDEADQMMDESFKADSVLIAEACPDKLQLALFSATVSPGVQGLMDELFEKANIIKSAGSGKTVKTLKTKNVKVIDGKRWPVLEKILSEEVDGGTLIFANTREQCDNIVKELKEQGYDCAVYRGEMDKNERRQNLKKFREGKVNLLVATDVAGRGIDIENVERVINYHLPRQMDNYIHRAGRTARAGRSGLVVNLVTERDELLMARLEGREPVRQSFERGRDIKGRSEASTKPTSGSSPKSAPKSASKGPTKAKSGTASYGRPTGRSGEGSSSIKSYSGQQRNRK